MASPEMQQLKAMYKTGSLSMDEFLFMSKDLQQTSLAEEEEEASAHDGQSSSHASHDGGAYGNCLRRLDRAQLRGTCARP